MRRFDSARRAGHAVLLGLSTLACLVVGGSTIAAGDTADSPASLTVLTWGGAYEASQRAAYFEPFTRQTGIEVRVARYDGGIEALRREVESGRPAWDVVDLVTADAQAACREGLLEPFDAGIDKVDPDAAVHGEPTRHGLRERQVGVAGDDLRFLIGHVAACPRGGPHAPNVTDS